MAESELLKLGARPLRLAELRRVYEGPVTVGIAPEALLVVREAHALTARLAAADAPAYGINTGFGLLANTRIAPAQRTLLQRNIILSHSAGVGALLDDSIVRLTLVLKLASLLQGFSGVSEGLARLLERLINGGLLPCVPAQGSVGASGDLAPLAHLSLAVLGLGTVRRHGEVLPAAEALAQEGLTPLSLGPKEGLALLNGTQVSTALALAGLFELEKIYAGAVVSGALSVDALQGSDVPFDPRIQHLRGHDGQARVAGVYRDLLAGSEIRESHRTCSRVQDPYSLRCQPQVMGACLDLMTQQADILTTEANAVTDNPLVFAATGEVLSGGNFHAERTAGVPRPRQRGQLGLHAGAGDRRSAGRGEPHALPPGEHRQYSDLCEPGGSRQHGDARRPAAPRHDSQRPPHRRHRASHRLSGHRPSRPAQDLATTCGRAQRAAPLRALCRERPAARARYGGSCLHGAAHRGTVTGELALAELPLSPGEAKNQQTRSRPAGSGRILLNHSPGAGRLELLLWSTAAIAYPDGRHNHIL